MTSGTRAVVIRRSEIASISRSNGISSIPYVERHRCAGSRITTGTTTLPPGGSVALHSHNVEEAVIVVSGKGVVEIGTEQFDLGECDATWIPANVPHRFINPEAAASLCIYWVY